MRPIKSATSMRTLPLLDSKACPSLSTNPLCSCCRAHNEDHGAPPCIVFFVSPSGGSRWLSWLPLASPTRSFACRSRCRFCTSSSSSLNHLLIVSTSTWFARLTCGMFTVGHPRRVAIIVIGSLFDRMKRSLVLIPKWLMLRIYINFQQTIFRWFNFYPELTTSNQEN